MPIHAWLSVRMPCKLLLLPIKNQQQSMHQKLFHPHARAGVQVLLHIACSTFCTSQIAMHATASIEHKSNIPSQQASCESVGSAASWKLVCRWTVDPWNGPPPGPRPSKGIHSSMPMNFVSTGAVARS
eukprot:294115-Pelagomonas_calceolata.AAC.6